MAVIALLSPEIILTITLHQYLVVREYQRALNAAKPGREHKNDSRLRQTSTNESHDSQKGKNKEDIGLKMSFFAIMGGFCYEYKASTGSHWRTLAFDTLLRRKTMEIIREYPLSSIEDKSKASGITKTVAFVQPDWLDIITMPRKTPRWTVHSVVGAEYFCTRCCRHHHVCAMDSETVSCWYIHSGRAAWLATRHENIQLHRQVSDSSGKGRIKDLQSCWAIRVFNER